MAAILLYLRAIQLIPFLNVLELVRWILCILIVSLASPGCRKDNNRIPFVPVDFTININEPQWFNLISVTGWEYVTGGSRGIVIYRHTLDEFVAYDRHSTHNVDDGCRVEVADDNITLDDECSDSQWLIIDGSVLSGPATVPLQPYNTTFNDPFLRIYN